MEGYNSETKLVLYLSEGCALLFDIPLVFQHKDRVEYKFVNPGNIQLLPGIYPARVFDNGKYSEEFQMRIES